MRCGSYNHYYTPNSTSYDCVCNEGANTPTPYESDAFRSARSRHTGGVNMALGDGSVRFVSNSIGSLRLARAGHAQRAARSFRTRAY